MTMVKVAFAVLCFATFANALVSIPDAGLRPPKRPPPPSPPTLPPLPYAAAIPDIPVFQPSVPFIPITRIVPVFSVVPVNKVVPTVPEEVRSQPSTKGSFNSPLSQPGLPSPVFRDEVKDKMGQFELRHSDGKGTLINESGKLISTDDGWEYVIVKEGDYSYTSPEGSPVLVKYVADENGVKTSFSIRSQ